MLNKLKKLKFETQSYTVGPKSISKQDIIRKINRVVQFCDNCKA